MKLDLLFESILLERSQSTKMSSKTFKQALDNPDLMIGFECEFKRVVSPSQGIEYKEQEEVAEELSEHLGVHVMSIAEGDMKYSGGWYLEPDSTSDLELVSPVLPAKEAIGELMSVYKFLQQPDYETTEEEGLHINVSIKGKTWEDYDHLKAVLFLGEENLLQQFDREDNEWAEPQVQRLRQALSKMSHKYMPTAGGNREIDPYAVIRDKNIQRFAKEVADNVFNKTRYRGYNVEKMYPNDEGKRGNYIEFRLLGNAGYEYRMKETLDAIGRYAFVMEAGTSDKYDREYKTKLARIFAQSDMKDINDAEFNAMVRIINQKQAVFMNMFKDLRGNPVLESPTVPDAVKGVHVNDLMCRNPRGVMEVIMNAFNGDFAEIEVAAEFGAIVGAAVIMYVYGKIKQEDRNWFKMVHYFMRLNKVSFEHVRNYCLVSNGKLETSKLSEEMRNYLGRLK